MGNQSLVEGTGVMLTEGSPGWWPKSIDRQPGQENSKEYSSILV